MCGRSSGRRAIVHALLASVIGATFATTVAHAAFPGANGRITFASQRDIPDVLNLYSMAPDGGSVTRLTSSFVDTDPAWSPDGTKIAFVSYRDLADSEIYVMNADGSAETRL